MEQRNIEQLYLYLPTCSCSLSYPSSKNQTTSNQEIDRRISTLNSNTASSQTNTNPVNTMAPTNISRSACNYFEVSVIQGVLSVSATKYYGITPPSLPTRRRKMVGCYELDAMLSDPLRRMASAYWLQCNLQCDQFETKAIRLYTINLPESLAKLRADIVDAVERGICRYCKLEWAPLIFDFGWPAATLVAEAVSISAQLAKTPPTVVDSRSAPGRELFEGSTPLPPLWRSVQPTSGGFAERRTPESTAALNNIVQATPRAATRASRYFVAGRLRSETEPPTDRKGSRDSMAVADDMTSSVVTVKHSGEKIRSTG